ncbi:pyridoxamine 5'-phosphate oxidase family protein [Streptomyces sp. NRRL F-5135]|uniref:pyridoxamine 5'-phosphate oxidase family protein n=1 Tax=Streptomyces sp. NRRL F-5135 TaxID=1463858 RepID=UPI00099BB587|nr:TIGR03618 family F420-dependent PPOX class oxidoreductase [Streptomyces sp. NRRL F-5135]
MPTPTPEAAPAPAPADATASTSGTAPTPAPAPARTPAHHDVRNPSPDFLAFWREHHLCTLTTVRADGTPHVVPVGVTYDPEAGLARVISDGNSRKVTHVLAAGPEGARVAVCQVDRARWATLEGRATVRREPEAVADAERRYEERYGHPPRVNPNRVVIEIALDRAMGRGWARKPAAEGNS